MLKNLILLLICSAFTIGYFSYLTEKNPPQPKGAVLGVKTVNNTKSQYVVDSTELAKIPTNEKYIVLTFDGGSGTQSLDKILLTLRKTRVNASFFVTGKWAEQNPKAVKKITSYGFEVYNHSYSHPNFVNLSDAQIRAEIRKGEQKISAVTGKTSKPLFRPPYGGRDARVRKIVASEGYKTIIWTVDALDWKESYGVTNQQVKDRVMTTLAPGNIYLMHIGDNITGNVLAQLIFEIKAQGYQFKSLSQGLGI